MQIIYLTRFSYFGRSGWRAPASRAPEELFAPERLRARLAMFQRYTLPSLAAQSDGDFQHLVLSSTLMPRPWRRRLKRAVQGALGDRGRVIFRRQGSAGHMIRRHVRASFADQDHVVQVVLDDDDALSADYNAVLRYHVRTIIDDPNNDDEATFLSFPRGLTLGLDAQGFPAWLAERNVPFTNLGLALLSRPDYRKNPFMTSHRRIGERQATRLIGAKRPFYLRAVHGLNDSRAIAAAERHAPHEVEGLIRHFPFMEGLVARRDAALAA